jgi:hypothetical protein
MGTVSGPLHEAEVLVEIVRNSSGVGWLKMRYFDPASGKALWLVESRLMVEAIYLHTIVYYTGLLQEVISHADRV